MAKLLPLLAILFTVYHPVSASSDYELLVGTSSDFADTTWPSCSGPLGTSGPSELEPAASSDLQDAEMLLDLASQNTRNQYPQAITLMVPASLAAATLSRLSQKFATGVLATQLHFENKDALGTIFAIVSGVSSFGLAYTSLLQTSKLLRFERAKIYFDSEATSGKLMLAFKAMVSATSGVYLFHLAFPTLDITPTIALGLTYSTSIACIAFNCFYELRQVRRAAIIANTESQTQSIRRTIWKSKIEAIRQHVAKLSTVEFARQYRALQYIDSDAEQLEELLRSAPSQATDQRRVHRRAKKALKIIGNITSALSATLVSAPLAKAAFDYYLGATIDKRYPVSVNSVMAAAVAYHWYLILKDAFAARYYELYSLCASSDGTTSIRELAYNISGTVLGFCSSSAIAYAAYVACESTQALNNIALPVALGVWITSASLESGGATQFLRSTTEYVQSLCSPVAAVKTRITSGLGNLGAFIANLRGDYMDGLAQIDLS